MEHDIVINDRIFVRSFVKGKNIRLLMFSIRFTTTAQVFSLMNCAENISVNQSRVFVLSTSTVFFSILNK